MWITSINNPTENVNRVTAVRFTAGRTQHYELPVKGGVEILEGMIVEFDGNGVLVPLAGAKPVSAFYVARQTRKSTDLDFADDKRISVEAPQEFGVELEMPVTNWALTQADVGKQIDFADDSTGDAGTLVPLGGTVVIHGVITPELIRGVFTKNSL